MELIESSSKQVNKDNFTLIMPKFEKKFEIVNTTIGNFDLNNFLSYYNNGYASDVTLEILYVNCGQTFEFRLGKKQHKGKVTWISDNYSDYTGQLEFISVKIIEPDVLVIVYGQEYTAGSDCGPEELFELTVRVTDVEQMIKIRKLYLSISHDNNNDIQA